MKNAIVVMLMLNLSWLGCHKANNSNEKLVAEEITLDRQKIAGRLIKEAEVPLEVAILYKFMTINSDKALFLSQYVTRNEIKLQRFDLDLSRKASHSFMAGQGPGEWFGVPEFIGFEDTTLMIDPGADRITWYDDKMNLVDTLQYRFKAAGGAGVYGDLTKKGDGLFGLYYYVASYVRGKQGYFSGDDIKILGGTINAKKVDCDVFYEIYRGTQKTKAPVYEVGEKILFTLVGDSLYLVDAETYTLTRMSLDGVPLRSVRVKMERPEFSKKDLQKWEKGFSNQKVDEHKGQWNPTWLYPSPLWPVAGMMELGKGLAVITCENYDPENKPDMLKADYFDLDLNYVGVIEIPIFSFWNCPMPWHSLKTRRVFRWQMDRLFYIDDRDEDQTTLSRWRLEQ